jgi:hypothetical protein
MTKLLDLEKKKITEESEIWVKFLTNKFHPFSSLRFHEKERNEPAPFYAVFTFYLL